MALTVHSLASGSSGNSILVRDEGGAVLIDAGISVRSIVSALTRIEMNPADLSAILITHEHWDHISGAVDMALRYKVPIIANASTLSSIEGSEHVPHRVLDVGEEVEIGSLVVRSFPVSHDAIYPVGYTISYPGVTVCNATDTGIITPELRSEATQANLLILESNHDIGMLRSGSYPWHLKQRILGDKGHLSNDTTAEFLTELADAGRPVSVWLAHLSKTNNSPKVALAAARKLLSESLNSSVNVEVAKRDAPSLVWRQGAKPFQLSLFTPQPLAHK